MQGTRTHTELIFLVHSCETLSIKNIFYDTVRYYLVLVFNPFRFEFNRCESIEITITEEEEKTREILLDAFCVSFCLFCTMGLNRVGMCD